MSAPSPHPASEGSAPGTGMGGMLTANWGSRDALDNASFGSYNSALGAGDYGDNKSFPEATGGSFGGPNADSAARSPGGTQFTVDNASFNTMALIGRVEQQNRAEENMEWDHLMTELLQTRAQEQSPVKPKAPAPAASEPLLPLVPSPLPTAPSPLTDGMSGGGYMGRQHHHHHMQQQHHQMHHQQMSHQQMHGHQMNHRGPKMPQQQQQAPMQQDLPRGVQFELYPPNVENPAGMPTMPPHEPNFTKVFIGNLRFEMSRATIAWAVKTACGVDVTPDRVLPHMKSNQSGHPSVPTGCASVFVPAEEAGILLAAHQKVFCGAKGIFIAPTVDAMRQMVRERRVVDKGPDGRIKGPKHPMVVEISKSAGNNGGGGGPPNGSFNSIPRATPPLMMTHVDARTFRYDPNSTTPPPHGATADAKAPEAELFVGGICYEATEHFVAWLLRLTGVFVRMEHVQLFKERSGRSQGCAIVKVDNSDVDTLLSYSHRILCDANGAAVVETSDEMNAYLQQNMQAKGDAKGPTHAVVIEHKRQPSNHANAGQNTGVNGLHAGQQRGSPLPTYSQSQSGGSFGMMPPMNMMMMPMMFPPHAAPTNTTPNTSFTPSTNGTRTPPAYPSYSRTPNQSFGASSGCASPPAYANEK